MHTQVKSVKSVRVQIPEELSNRSFCFKTYFALGNERTTNLSARLGDFDDAFFNNAKCKCQMPPALSFVDTSVHQVETIACVMASVDPWESRVPIKLVGFFKQKQLTGLEDGLLLADGRSNHFICRSCNDELKLVEMHLHQPSRSWRISSVNFDPNHAIEGSCRIFLGCR